MRRIYDNRTARYDGHFSLAGPAGLRKYVHGNRTYIGNFSIIFMIRDFDVQTRSRIVSLFLTCQDPLHNFLKFNIFLSLVYVIVRRQKSGHVNPFFSKISAV